MLVVIILSIVICTSTPVDAAAQGWTEVRFSESPTLIEPAVNYLPRAPIIDGKLDDELTDLPTRHFSILWKCDPGNPTVPVNYRQELAEVYPYETAAPSRIKLSQLLDHLAVAEQGQDVFAQRRGFVRMAYRSKLDDTLQPYVVYLPEDFDPARKYPLLVYLHGSASTERTIIGWQGIPDGFIALGPKGRGPSNWFSWDDAQTDVAEAIRAVQANFPIDQDRILLVGFSMGGYGVYRTFYETPDTYRAIAVFSGIPRVHFGAPEGLDLIDFNEERYLAPFKAVPTFVFHGKRDLNVPYSETEAFVAKLKRAGALVEFHTEENKGHENPDEETMATFHQWIKKVFGD